MVSIAVLKIEVAPSNPSASRHYTDFPYGRSITYDVDFTLARPSIRRIEVFQRRGRATAALGFFPSQLRTAYTAAMSKLYFMEWNAA